jgi:hypothetical protein
VYKVFSYFKREADAGMPIHDVAKHPFFTRDLLKLNEIINVLCKNNLNKMLKVDQEIAESAS